MPSLTMSRSSGAGPVSVSRQKTITGDNLVTCSKSLSAAKTGTLTTRTDANTGTLTMDAGHGITTGQVVSIFWDGGVQYNVTVGTVSGNSVPIDTGSGVDLPATSTAVKVQVQNIESNNWNFAGSDVLAILVGCTAPFVVLFMSGSDIVAAYYSDASDGDAFFYDSEETTSFALNPLDGETIDAIRFAHGSSAASATINVAVLNN